MQDKLKQNDIRFQQRWHHSIYIMQQNKDIVQP